MPGAGALGHHVQELALLGQAGEHGAHVPHGHVADTGGDGGQSQGAAWGGEAGGALGEAVEEAGAQGTRKQAGVIAVIHDGIKINLGCLKQLGTLVFLPGESQGQEAGGLPSMGSRRVGHD